MLANIQIRGIDPSDFEFNQEYRVRLVGYGSGGTGAPVLEVITSSTELDKAREVVESARWGAQDGQTKILYALTRVGLAVVEAIEANTGKLAEISDTLRDHAPEVTGDPF